jgi:hypothetical protein
VCTIPILVIEFSLRDCPLTGRISQLYDRTLKSIVT